MQESMPSSAVKDVPTILTT
ncbi:rCG36998 [Rattus norvegicus]|uniref:RCG36998 n=1 Tax=Rattus norvegicus TaxID=10116 RepID=A6HU99_RAT|nr:rCG36998 [Rattus norvegicus]